MKPAFMHLPDQIVIFQCKADRNTHSFPARVARGPQSDQPGGSTVVCGDCNVANSPSNQQGHSLRSKMDII